MKKPEGNKSITHLPSMNPQLDSEVRRILQDLSSTRENQPKSTSSMMSDTIFALKLSKYDS